MCTKTHVTIEYANSFLSIIQMLFKLDSINDSQKYTGTSHYILKLCPLLRIEITKQVCKWTSRELGWSWRLAQAVARGSAKRHCRLDRAGLGSSGAAGLGKAPCVCIL